MECSWALIYFHGEGGAQGKQLYMWFLIGRGLLFISYLAQPDSGGQSSQTTGKRRSAIEAGCNRVIMTQNVWECMS